MSITIGKLLNEDGTENQEYRLNESGRYWRVGFYLKIGNKKIPVESELQDITLEGQEYPPTLEKVKRLQEACMTKLVFTEPFYTKDLLLPKNLPL